MIITVNGEKKECKENVTLEDWLSQQGYVKARIAVEINEKILPKAEYGNYVLKENDTLEVVSFVGGG